MASETLCSDSFCSLSRRLVVILYDSLIAAALLFLVTIGWLPFTGGDAITAGDPRHFFYQASLLLTIWFYLALSWRNGGQTLGAKAWRVRLVSEDQTPVGWWQSTVRMVVALVGIAALGAGFLWSVRHPHKATWHDLASHTQLLKQTAI